MTEMKTHLTIHSGIDKDMNSLAETMEVIDDLIIEVS